MKKDADPTGEKCIHYDKCESKGEGNTCYNIPEAGGKCIDYNKTEVYNPEISLEEYLNDPNSQKTPLILHSFTFEQIVELHGKVCDDLNNLIDENHFIDGKADKTLMTRFFNALMLKVAIQENIDATRNEILKKAKITMTNHIRLHDLNSPY